MTQALYDAAKDVVRAWEENWRDGGTEVKMLALHEIVNDPGLLATPEENLAARHVQGCADFDVDDFAYASRGEGGVWVQAWVWVPTPDEEQQDD